VNAPRALAVTRHAAAGFPDVRQRFLDVYADVYAHEARSDPFFSLPRFTARLDGHARHLGWACAIGAIGDETAGYSYGRPDSGDECRNCTLSPTGWGWTADECDGR
jgi:hypothetical protein